MKRLPNNYGSVVKQSGKRRNPYIAKKADGKNEKGHPIYKIIGYYPDKESAFTALAEFNRNPYNVDNRKMTLSEVYEKWREWKSPQLEKKNVDGITAAYKVHSKSLYSMPYTEIRSYHIQKLITSCRHGASTQRRIKQLFSHLDKLAFEMGVINKTFAQLVTIDKAPESTGAPFTHEEVNKLWTMKDDPYVDIILIYLLSGVRKMELLDLKTENVNLDDWTLKIIKSKTNAGIRTVPIHDKIKPFIMARMARGNEYLITKPNGKKFSESGFNRTWENIRKQIGTERVLHDTRHTFMSWLDSAGVGRATINKIVGHSGEGTGEKVYTHKTLEELRKAIKLIAN